MGCCQANSEVDGIIALIGPPGSGRTSFMCNATGANYQGNGNSVKCQTCKVEAGLYTDGCGHKILLIDTPGIGAPLGRGEKEISEEDVSQAVRKWLQGNRYDDRLAGILFFQQLKAKRPETPSISCFRGLCQSGVYFYSSVVLVGTMGDDTDLRRFEEGTWRNLISQGVKSLRYQNTSQSAREAISMIIK
ncbi:hypothetical protein F5J12DRAFT_115259 [Pisolithus orientalis]|uniref:uncharacterized protein n=1 Tax=Pisolithus orientalis TaxID=936130 RepID=UPI00222558C7|nr:uncharacterized protein F5J12DRAFT_115259 [Pisolithus orientalis]KAI6006314.1 hypothetical protein F5J12DRAFT_115259 [Pisolithus orientalis]